MKQQFNDEPIVIVTGGVGFIGSCLVRNLNDAGVKNIILVDDLGKGIKWRNLLGKSFIDVLDKSQLFKWLEGKESAIGAIVHLGACTKTIEDDASYLLENNYRYTVNLAEYAFRNDIRFVYASSAATYGDGQQGFSDSYESLENLRSLNMYGMSKQLFDVWAKREGYLDKIVGLKFFNVFGPNEFHKGRMASAIVHVLPTIQKEGVIRLFKSSQPDLYCDGGQMRDFVYVKDVVRMICAFLSNGATGLFNIASGRAASWNDLAAAIFSALNLPLKIEYIPMPEDLIGKYQNYTCADMEKTRAAIGNIADCMTLEDSVKDYIQNYLLPDQIW
ncbi:MAG: ADP-glyceromanno-heptose 6-epimerase [Parachlamydiaceae bacterium]|nr:ADP-glyceromanno-heptose 6-epimerase [Parachlamydiaceae bacterium]